MNINNIYKNKIFEKYKDLKNSGKDKDNFTNYDLCIIFEYFTCLKLSEEKKTNFYCYDDIEPDFKELNDLSRIDTGIDCCDLKNTIVQCKLRKNQLTWKDCSTFFGSQNIFDTNLNKTIVRWENLIIARNDDCQLSKHLIAKQKLYVDKSYSKESLVKYCEDLLINYEPIIEKKEKLILRNYQTECIELINSTKKNVVISLPTGCGKNVVITHSLKLTDKNKYLISVPTPHGTY